MTRLPLFGVEYQTDADRTTYEIFGDIDQAKEFAGTVVALYLFSADFDADSVHLEDGKLNYEDHADLYNNVDIIETYISCGDGLEAFDNLIDSFADDDDKLEYQAKLDVLAKHVNETNSELERYKQGYNELMCYWDSISDEEKPELHERLLKLGL